jgi:hypothetical protein
MLEPKIFDTVVRAEFEVGQLIQIKLKIFEALVVSAVKADQLVLEEPKVLDAIVRADVEAGQLILI